MRELLRLDACVLWRNRRSLGWTGLMIGAPAAFATLGGSDGSLSDVWGWLAGMIAFAGLIGWFMILAQVEGVIAVAPVSLRRRTLHHVVLGGLMTLPTVGFAAAAAGTSTALAAGLLLLGGIVLFSLIAVLMRRLPSWLQILWLAGLFFVPPFAVGAQVAFAVLPVHLPLWSAATLLLVLLYVGGVRGLETGWALETSRRSPPPAPRGPGAALDRAVRPSPLWILFRTTYLRWFAGLGVVFILGAACLPGSAIVVWLTASMAVLWPLHVWTGFQASPLPRPQAYRVLIGPIILVWIAAAACSAVGSAAWRDTRFVDADANGVVLGRPRGWDADTQLGLRGGGYRLPEDPREAASRTSHYLRRVFGLRVAPSEILALKPEDADRTSAGWLRAVETRLRPAIRAAAVWIGALLALGMLLAILLYANLYYLASRRRSAYNTVFMIGMLAFSFAQMLPKNAVSDLMTRHVRDAALAWPWAVAAALGAACLLLLARHAAAFRDLEAGNLAWTVTSGEATTS